MITYTWSIDNLVTDFTEGSFVCTAIYWTCTGKDEDGNSSYISGVHGVITSDGPRSSVDWDSLTEDQVVSILLEEISQTDDIATADSEGEEDTVVNVSQKDETELAISEEINKLITFYVPSED
jgi:hypothetical protein